MEGQAQAEAALKKRKKAKEKSPIWISSPKRKRLELASQAEDLGKVSINSTSGLHVLSFVHTHNPQRIPGISYGSNVEEMSKEMQKLRRSSALKKRNGSVKKVTSSAPKMLKESHVSHAFKQSRSLQLGISLRPKMVVGYLGFKFSPAYISRRGLHSDISHRGSSPGCTL